MRPTEMTESTVNILKKYIGIKMSETGNVRLLMSGYRQWSTLLKMSLYIPLRLHARINRRATQVRSDATMKKVFSKLAVMMKEDPEGTLKKFGKTKL